MNPKNLRNLLSCSLKCLSLVHKSAYNMKYSLSSIGQCLNRDLFLFQFVGAKDLNPAGSFLWGQTFFGAFQLLKHFLNRNPFLLTKIKLRKRCNY
jgi:hypothetical protein